MHVGSKTFGERQLEIFEVGEMQFTFFLPRGLNIGLIKRFCVRARIWYDTLRARRATKALRCFTILTLTLFLRCIFQIPPCVNRKIVATRNARGMSARRVITMSVLSDIFAKQPHPRPRKSLGWGWLPARVGLC